MQRLKKAQLLKKSLLFRQMPLLRRRRLKPQKKNRPNNEMKVGIILSIALVFLFGCAVKEKKVEGLKSEDSPIYPFHKEVLKDGLTVIVKEIHSTPIVAVHFWVNTGAVNENGNNNGLSHFFEHMF